MANYFNFKYRGRMKGKREEKKKIKPKLIWSQLSDGIHINRKKRMNEWNKYQWWWEKFVFLNKIKSLKKREERKKLFVKIFNYIYIEYRTICIPFHSGKAKIIRLIKSNNKNNNKNIVES